MKKIVLGSVVCLFMVTASMAQRMGPHPLKRMSSAETPLVIIDSMITDFDNLAYLNPNLIESVTILKSSEAIEPYGDKGKNGVLVIKMKSTASLLKLTDVLNQYTISEQDRGLKVCKDNFLVQDPSTLLLDKKAILRVEVITDMYWKNPMEPGPEEKYINIVMVKPTNKIIP
jgi:hypothetical protein